MKEGRTKGTKGRRKEGGNQNLLYCIYHITTNYPKIKWLETTNIYYLTVSTGLESRKSLPESFSSEPVPGCRQGVS